MAIFNKQGDEFEHLVRIDCPKNHRPTYTHKFPVVVGTHVEDRWSTKVRPIKSMTNYLKGCELKRYTDYMVQFNKFTNKFEYWFKEGQYATLFALRVSGMKQEYGTKKPALYACCSNCGHTVPRHEIEWKA